MGKRAAKRRSRGRGNPERAHSAALLLYGEAPRRELLDELTRKEFAAQ